ncbi:hypothetical protein Verru16b_02455 [Lacunisphaera limnophila]|uniref:Type 4 fimbrial biogenesis protein PilX N-terminal domain-containing protein n=1 Tax=Lacunisphaera limnophila TaxID=1838286 RepID=A0A1D8AWX1_9BACT|nr:hypothetical protein [Lacunisphaera limnophila]AOS45374.1 hypothetical protein Verru16b_02455 [Lacunisphaera limnophila]
MKNRLLSIRGSALATTVILTTVIGLTAVVLLKYSMSEFRLNQRTNLRFQAKNATEAMLEYGSAELMARIQASVNFATSELTTNPLTVPSARKTTLFAQSATAENDVAPGTMRFWASQVSDSTRRLIDPGDPGNDFDPLRGQYATTKIIKLLAQATAAAGDVTATSYGTETMEIRDAFLFNYAIFYNITMEFHPGADMTIAGPVHSNVSSYISASSTLRFQNAVTAAGSILAGPQSNAGTGRPTGQNVQFATGLDLNLDGVPDTMALNSNTILGANGSALGTYVDSALASRSAGNTFSSVASQTWRGNVQDSSMGIITQNLPAITADTPAEAHDLIEPRDPSVSGASAAAVQSRESQKFANKAGLYIVQGAPGTDGAASGTPPAPVAFRTSADAAAYKAAANRTTWRSSNPDKIVILPTDTVKNNRRMYDHREGRTVNTVDLDVGKLRTSVQSTTSGSANNIKVYNSGTGTHSSDWDLDATGGWNGQVYVEVENPTSGYTASTDVGGMTASGTGTRTAVRLVNGTALPNRKAVTAAAPEGFTVATNAAVYVVGNYNSPGLNAGTRSGTAVGTETTATIGDPKDGEVPAAVIADAVNILSSAWWNSGSGVPSGDANSSAAVSSRVAANTEICAAFLTGNVATAGSGNNNSNYSGGVENFPRLHENWTASGNRTLRYRGSMIALFNSEVATGPWANASYGAPTREWGFSKLFGTQGRYPPGTPMIRSFRRLDYRDLSATQFAAILADTAYAFDEM